MDQMYRPANKGLHGSKKLIRGNHSEYYTDEWDKKTGSFKLKDGYSYVAHQDAPNALAAMTSRTRKKDGGFFDGGTVKIYKKVNTPAPVAAPAPAPAPAPTPAPPPPKPKEPIKHSSEIEQAKERVKAYENGKSPWEQAQANVQSSFIKDTGSNFNKQFDFSSNSFEAKESPEPKEQAQAAQNLAQNFISKYSQYKSST